MIGSKRLNTPVDPSVGSTGVLNSDVNPRFTPRRRSKRAKKDVETTEFIGAARRFIRAAGRRVGVCDEPELAALLELKNVLDEAIAEAVQGQRAHGKSWAAIARGTGASREAAYKRWGKNV